MGTLMGACEDDKDRPPGPCKRCDGTGSAAVPRRGEGGDQYMELVTCPDCGGKGDGAPADLGKCPWCGAVANMDVIQAGAYHEWLCGSFVSGGDPGQSDKCRIRELEAEVAAREARCAALVELITGVGQGATYLAGFRCEHGEPTCEEAERGGLCNSCWVRGWAETIAEEVAHILACPDVAASRLLAAGAWRVAWDAYQKHVDDCAACCDYLPCDEGGHLRSVLDAADDTCRAAAEAEENPDGES